MRKHLVSVAAVSLIVVLSSAVLSAAHVTAQGATVETEVRITAQRLADGRTEFALQHRERDGDWSQRDLPRARFLPASVSVGRWLVSTPLAVEVPQVEASPFVGSPGSDRERS